MNEFPIVLAMDHESTKYMGPLISSIKKYVKNYHIYLITDKEVNMPDCTVIIKENTFKGPYSSITGHTYYRLFIDELIPDIKKCLYLDFDTIIVNDISDLLDGDDWIVKAAADPLIPFFNAGVVAFNFTDECKAKMQEARNMIKDGYDDQYILNYVFKDSFTKISLKYNINGFLFERTSEDKIIHYIGGTKPWNWGSCYKYYFDLI